MRRILRSEIQAVASVPLFMEYEAVLLRPVPLKAARVSSADVNNLLDVLAGVIVPVEVFYLWRPQLKDANDDMVLEAAVCAVHLFCLPMSRHTPLIESSPALSPR